jgi:tetratricopeptide (TPR) repeat protein
MRSAMLLRSALPSLALLLALAPSAFADGGLTAEEARTLQSDVRVGIALQDRMARTLPPAGVERVFSAMARGAPESRLLAFLAARARGGAEGATAMRALLVERLGLPVSERGQIGAGWAALARLQGDLGQLDAGLESAGYALRLDPRAETHALGGWLFQKKGDLASAIKAYGNAVKANPRALGARLALTELFLRAGKLEDALTTARATLLLAPRSAQGQLQWGTALALSGNTDDARKAYQRAMRLAGTNPDAVAAVAAALRRIEGQSLAVDGLRRAHAANPKHLEVAVQFASLLLEVGRAKEARAVSISALAQHETDARLWFLKGTAEEATLVGREAVQSYQRAIKHDPDKLEYRLALAAALRRVKEVAQALAAYKQAALRFPEERRAREMYGRALMEQQMYAEAVVEFEEAVRLAPQDPNPSYLVAVVRGLHLGQVRPARKAMERYLALGGSDPAALEWLDRLRQQDR